jgi:hypothetical protein
VVVRVALAGAAVNVGVAALLFVWATDQRERTAQREFGDALPLLHRLEQSFAGLTGEGNAVGAGAVEAFRQPLECRRCEIVVFVERRDYGRRIPRNCELFTGGVLESKQRAPSGYPDGPLRRGSPSNRARRLCRR